MKNIILVALILLLSACGSEKSPESKLDGTYISSTTPVRFVFDPNGTVTEMVLDKVIVVFPYEKIGGKLKILETPTPRSFALNNDGSFTAEGGLQDRYSKK